MGAGEWVREGEHPSTTCKGGGTLGLYYAGVFSYFFNGAPLEMCAFVHTRGYDHVVRRCPCPLRCGTRAWDAFSGRAPLGILGSSERPTWRDEPPSNLKGCEMVVSACHDPWPGPSLMLATDFLPFSDMAAAGAGSLEYTSRRHFDSQVGREREKAVKLAPIWDVRTACEEDRSTTNTNATGTFCLQLTYNNEHHAKGRRSFHVVNSVICSQGPLRLSAPSGVRLATTIILLCPESTDRSNLFSRR